MEELSADRTEFSDNTLSGSDKHSMGQSTVDNDEVNNFVNRNKSDK
jgi:type IV secretion system protein VirB6/type IV secretion system protein TrbL